MYMKLHMNNKDKKTSWGKKINPLILGFGN
jgi:hypothetical protein